MSCAAVVFVFASPEVRLRYGHFCIRRTSHRISICIRASSSLEHVTGQGLQDGTSCPIRSGTD